MFNFIQKQMKESISYFDMEIKINQYVIDIKITGYSAIKWWEKSFVIIYKKDNVKGEFIEEQLLSQTPEEAEKNKEIIKEIKKILSNI